MWDKQSNSENTLKLIIPGNGLKTISGWINYSCKVISYKIKILEIGYCGSKSIINLP